MSFDPTASPDHYVVGPIVFNLGGSPAEHWVVCRPGVVHGEAGQPLRNTLSADVGPLHTLVFLHKEDAENLAAALNHGKYLRAERSN